MLEYPGTEAHYLLVDAFIPQANNHAIGYVDNGATGKSGPSVISICRSVQRRSRPSMDHSISSFGLSS
jgi:hypothetical protein